ncbi:MAG TPA: DUF397 domain-containing protein [Pseudonocardiaceae bacterium]|jgi:hypothetical protein|nr:DUF397 domain-containing protein [Pseudonocardiaceae bacterium]
MVEGTRPVWRKSSYSGGNNGDCVEVAYLDGNVRAVRDSKNPAGPMLCVDAAFIVAAKIGKFGR